MKTLNRLKTRTIGLSVWSFFTATTLLLYLVKGMPAYPSRALPLLWCFFSWNFYAYAFDRGMWPWVFDELDGSGKGKASWRVFWFWFTAVMYAALLASIAFQQKSLT